MVTLKEISESLKKIKGNKEKIIYLKKVLEEVDDKKLMEDIKSLIDDIRELEEVIQVETRGKVEWSIPDDAPLEERRLERQIINAPIIKEEKKDDFKVNYNLNNLDFYNGKKGYESNNEYSPGSSQGNAFIQESPNAIESRVNDQFLGNSSRKKNDDPFMQKYESNESRGYSSLSEELHEKERKKLRH